MSTFDWIAAGVVILSMCYVTFVLTVPEWLAAVRKGEAVTLLPERKGKKQPFWVQVVMLILGILLCIPLFYYGWVPFLKFSPPVKQFLSASGLLIYILGIGIVLWARRTLGKNWGVSTSRQAKLRDDHELIQSGPYAFVRHPMYFGSWVFILGLLMLYPMWVILMLAVSMLAAFFMRARREEAVLAERFGSVWKEYTKRTTRFIPFIY
jgi:protein-S-isoprenylcysteine O-methyltransferase Ste14